MSTASWWEWVIFVTLALGCVAVLRQAWTWKRVLDQSRVTLRTPELFVDQHSHERQQRLATLQTPAVKSFARRHQVLDLVERRNKMKG